MTKLFCFHKNYIIELTLLIAAALSIIITGINIFIIIFSVLIHELGHIIAALICGIKSENFTFHGFGVEIVFPGKNPSPKKLFIISCGGPVMSLIIAFFSNMLNIQTLKLINLSIALVNFIPAQPLDGGNIIYLILSNYIHRQKLRKIMRLSGKVFGLIISLLGILILFISSFNISLLYIGLFMFFSADRQINPVVEITSAEHSEFEKGTIFIIDDSMSLLDAAGKLPVNSIGAIRNNTGKITSLVTPLYLYELSIQKNKQNLKNI